MRHKPSIRVLWSWSLYYLLPTVAVSAAVYILLIRLVLPRTAVTVAVALLIGAILVLAAYLPMRRKQMTFTLATDSLTATGGVLFTTYRRMPLAAVRHVTLLRGPIERLCGTAFLLVSAAGGHILVEGLPLDTAQNWCRLLLPHE